jgi:hypothetical protein
MAKKKKKDAKFLYELEQYDHQGISLLLDGIPSSPKAIAKAHKIAEEGTYMRDYIANEEGEVGQLSFDMIK